MVFTVIVFLLLLSVLVLVHELGHFIAAKKLGVKAEEFGIGFPPRVKKLFAWRGTEFTLNWLPLGGFVRLRGEDPVVKLPKIIAEKSGFFWAQKIWKRTLILLAGVTMNMVLAIAVFSIAYAVTGIPVKTDKVFIEAIAPESPAEKSSLKNGDQILEVISGNKNTSITDTDKFIEIVNQNLGREISLRVIKKVYPERSRRDITDITIINIIPRLKENTPSGEGSLGVVLSNIELVHYPWWKMPFFSAWFGLKEAFLWGVEIFTGLTHMFSNLIVRGQIPKDIAGPVGIASVTGRIAAQGIIPLLQFMGILSVNLAIVNVLPIPALDGGRLLFLIIEKLRGRPVNPKKEYWANLVGYALLITLILLITLNDIFRLLAA